MRTFDSYRELLRQVDQNEAVKNLTDTITNKVLKDAITKIEKEIADAKVPLEKAIKRNVVVFWGFGLSYLRIERYNKCKRRIDALHKEWTNHINAMEAKADRITLGKYKRVNALYCARVDKAKIRLERKQEPKLFSDTGEGFKIIRHKESVSVEDTVSGIMISYHRDGMTAIVPSRFLPGASGKYVTLRDIPWPTTLYSIPNRYDHIVELLFGHVDKMVRREPSKEPGEGGGEGWALMKSGEEEKVGTRVIVKDGE